MKVVLVQWMDARFSTAGWIPREVTPELHLANVITVGVLVDNRGEDIVLSPILSDINSAQDVCILKSSIKKMWDLTTKRRVI